MAAAGARAVSTAAPARRVALVGCGRIADGHVEQLRATGRGEVVAVCDREPLMAEQLATRFAVPARYADFTAMLAAEQPEVVHIATPPAAHLPLAREALEAGCHVFVEKPFTATAAEAAALLALGERHGRRIGVNYLYNFEAPMLELETLLARGALGRVVHLETAYGYNLGGDYGLAVMADPAHWVHALPGKLFHNVLDHVLAKLVPHLDDDPDVDVQAWRRRPAHGDPLLDAMPDELRFQIRSGDTSASGVISAHARPVAHTLTVRGTKDSVTLDIGARSLVPVPRQDQPSAIGRLLPAFVQARCWRRNAWRNLGRFRRHEFHYFQGMRVLLGRWYDALEGRGPDPVPPAHILRVARLIDAIVAGMDARA